MLVKPAALAGVQLGVKVVPLLQAYREAEYTTSNVAGV
jgi:hypothetical protein